MSIVQIILQIVGQILHVTFVSEAMACFSWSILPQNSLDYFLLNWDTYSDLTGPDNISVTSDSLLVLVVYSTNHRGWMLCAEVVSAFDDPHVSIVIKTSFDLWRTGWSTFVQVLINGI